jgi:GNAT superfamily N-acetyltransferase
MTITPDEPTVRPDQSTVRLDKSTDRPAEPTVRPAEPTDREAMWPLLNQLAMTFTPDRAAFDSALDALLVDPTARVLVAETPGLGVLGYVIAYCQTTLLANGPGLWVGELVVGEQARRSGVGRALMAQAEDWAREQGAAQIALATSRAHAFYVALGYDGAATYYRKKLR